MVAAARYGPWVPTGADDPIVRHRSGAHPVAQATAAHQEDVPMDQGVQRPPTRAVTTTTPEIPLAFAARAAGVLAFGIAFGYVEAAVVVDLRGALGVPVGHLFPLQQATGDAGRLIAIEVGRELATLVMLATVGLLAGSRPWERLAWAAVAFGAWDIAYYGWLRVFIGWPPDLSAWDVLFLVPAPWVGPVWAPVAVSASLAVVGVAAANRLRRGEAIPIGRWQVGAGVAGGGLVVGSFLAGTPGAMTGRMPTDYPWPVFAVGMLLAGAAALAAFIRRPQPEVPRSV